MYFQKYSHLILLTASHYRLILVSRSIRNLENRTKSLLKQREKVKINSLNSAQPPAPLSLIIPQNSESGT